MEQKTTLYETHVASGGKMVPFAGYLLPVQYETGVIREHLAVRTACGLFDVSHMGEILCEGTDAEKNLNWILTNDFSDMADGQARYSPMCTKEGGVVDDLIVYKVRQDHYFIVVNASNKDKDYQWMQQQVFGDCRLKDISAQVGQIALQGPLAGQILRRIAEETQIPKKYYTAVFQAEAAGIPCVISKTGYTGEDGFELYMAAEQAPDLWQALLEAGKEDGLIPCGLGARDTLRLEAAMPLYGHEMDETVSPLETGLGFAVKMKKEDFVGKTGLVQKGEPERVRVGLQVTGRGIIREHCSVYLGEEQIGQTTSGTHAPYLGYPIAMALVKRCAAAPGTEVEAEVRGRRIPAQIVELPFYRRKKV